MPREMVILMGTAASIGFIHTVLGPDHYLPFIVMSRARRWSIFKTITVTLLCGIGHIMSSVVLGLIGITLGIAVFKLEAIESTRGELAAWLLIIFGFTYFIWGLHRVFRGRPHRHFHGHLEGGSHSHLHSHVDEHSHIHGLKDNVSLTPWILFTIFVFGPCEPLIPILMYPAAKGSWVSVALASSVFGSATILTMLGMVLIFSYGLSRLPFGRVEKYSHALAGLTIFLCGAAIKFLGL